MRKVALIGGTGVYEQKLLQDAAQLTVSTRYGEAVLQKGLYRGNEVFFMARHSHSHALPPHLVNYRANIAALKRLGVSAVLATAAVGSLRESMPAGSMVVIDQFIDFTKSRISTFYDGEDGKVVHTDFTEPYCPELRSALLRAACRLEQKVVDGGCYLCTEGPRFETPAEIRMFRLLGGDLVGMTNVPEVVLAREAGLCYATVALVSNMAAGISSHKLTHEEVLEAVAEGKEDLDRLLMATLEEITGEPQCACFQPGKHWAGEEEAGS